MLCICLRTQKTKAGKPLRRLRRTDDNNDFLRLVNDNPVQLVEQTTSGPNAVGVRRRHTLPGLLVVFYPTEIGDFIPALRSNWH